MAPKISYDGPALCKWFLGLLKVVDLIRVSFVLVSCRVYDFRLGGFLVVSKDFSSFMLDNREFAMLPAKLLAANSFYCIIFEGNIFLNFSNIFI